MKKCVLLNLILVSTIYSGFTQKGTIRGKITDASTGQPMPFANVYVENNVTLGTTTDFDGLYTLKLDPGSYTIAYSFTSYKTSTETVEVKAGEIVVKNSALATSTTVLKAVEVIAERKEANTIAAFDIQKMKSINMVDGTSSEQMKKTGDGDAGEVVRRVTGVSVEGGKHVYVRGLGDRYTKTQLNHMEIPGLDPDRNTVQMDIFPTNLIDNITVYKTFTPDLPGDFTGGMVDIITKDFPTSKQLFFSVGLGYNSQAHFNDKFILYEGGKTDFLGHHDGTREKPVTDFQRFPDPTLDDPKLTALTKKFNPTMAVSNQPTFLNQSYSFGIGNQFNPEKYEIDYGYNVVLNYQNNYSFFESAEYNALVKPANSDNTALSARTNSFGNIGSNNVMWSALVGQSLKIFKRHKISLKAFHTQNGNSTAGNFKQFDFENNPSTLVKQSLQYSQRSVTNLNLSGKHMLKNWDVFWAVSPSLSKITDPDIRSTVVEEVRDPDNPNDVTYLLAQSVGAEVRRIYRYLDEKSINAKIDLEYNFRQWDSLPSKLKFGVAENMKKRTFSVFDYVFGLERVVEVENDPNWFFQPENIWTVETQQGTYARGERELANSFVASQQVYGAYIMNELPITKKLKTVYGFRVEKAANFYTGRNNNGDIRYFNKQVLDELDVLPAVNFVYALKDTIRNLMNIRGSFAATVARPSFREKSIAQVYDPIQNRRYIGNIDLQETHIYNADLRWEYFFGNTEVVSASVFYKKFFDPIELVSFIEAPNEIKPINTGEAEVYGLELELRKRIATFKGEQNKLYAGANFTWVNSRIDMNKVFISNEPGTPSEKQWRMNNARTGETISDYRPMSGQSPFIVNTYLNFSSDSTGWDANLSYNVQGKRLSVIGVGQLPDVYEQPFHSLNLRISKTLGKNKEWKTSLTGQNLLNNKRRKYYESYQADYQVYEFFYEGFTIVGTIAYILK